MNRNGAPAIILIYLIVTLPALFTDNKSYWPFAAATPLSAPINLYATFRDRLDATQDLAAMEYDTETLETVNRIYDLAGKILYEQVKQQTQDDDDMPQMLPTNRGLEYMNYAYRLLEDNVVEPTDNLPPASNASPMNGAKSRAVKKNTLKTPLTSTHIVLESNGNQLNEEQPRKVRKANHESYYHSHKTKESESGEELGSDHESSRSRLENDYDAASLPFPMGQGEGGEKWEQTPISGHSESEETVQSAASTVPKEQEAIEIVDENNDYDDEWDRLEWKRSWDNDASFNEAKAGTGAESEAEVEAENDYSDMRHERHEIACQCSDQCPKPNDNWQGKLPIDDDQRKKLRTTRSGPNPIGKQSYVAIESNELPNLANDLQVAEENAGVNGNDEYELHLNTRSIDAFPEVFTKPLTETGSSMDVSLSDTGLTEALRTANSLLTSADQPRAVSPVMNPVMSAVLSPDDPSHRIIKEIPTYEMSSLIPQSQNSQQQSGPKASEPSANLTNVMEKVLGELQNLKECKDMDNPAPEGSPCDLIGSWNSEAIGLQFHISLAEPAPAPTRAFLEGRRIDIEISERVPPRKHDLMDCEWVLKGTMLKQFGGPFYITAHRSDKHIVATFAGLCKVCGGIPTIFGSWTFVFPAKDCHDISMAIDNRRDVMRKDTLEAKRKHRMDSGVKGRCLTSFNR